MLAEVVGNLLGKGAVCFTGKHSRQVLIIRFSTPLRYTHSRLIQHRNPQPGARDFLRVETVIQVLYSERKEHDRFKQAVRSNVGDESAVLVWQHLGYKRCQVV